MFLILVSIAIPLALLLLVPWIFRFLIGRPPGSSQFLLIAVLLYSVSWFLPSPLIGGINTAFSTHLMGGGMFSGFLWLYFKKNLQWQGGWMVELVSLFGFVSTLGVLNELAEFALVQLGLIRLSAIDTWWDLLANTLGALLFWVSYRLVRILR